jgi:hypothetical protein
MSYRTFLCGPASPCRHDLGRESYLRQGCGLKYGNIRFGPGADDGSVAEMLNANRRNHSACKSPISADGLQFGLSSVTMYQPAHCYRVAMSTFLLIG